MENEKTQVSIEVPFSPRISRLFIFRFLYIFILMWPAILILFLVGLANQLHFWYMLILGKRAEFLFDLSKKAYIWGSKWKAYFGALTDEKPGYWF
jgi:hypothetical protein